MEVKNLESIQYVIVDQVNFAIYAFSDSGRQITVNYENIHEYFQGIMVCKRWLPESQIIQKY